MVAVEEDVEVVEEEVVAVEEEVEAVAAAEEEEVVEEVVEVMTMMTMMTTTVHLPSDQVHPVLAERDGGFSTIKKWNSDWPKSCKINDRWLRDGESRASRPPIPSQPLIRMDDALQ